MGDLVIVTASERVASWANAALRLTGPGGTRLDLRPQVILLSGARIEPLLDPAHPELALFAAWAMHDRHGSRARRVVERAIELTARLPSPLRKAQLRAILGSLSHRMLALLKQMAIDLKKIPETRASREVRILLEAREDHARDEGEAKGKTEALLAVLAARGLRPTAAERARIQGCHDIKALDRWIAAAVTAATVGEALAEPARRASKVRAASRAPRRRTPRSRTGE